jgi:hypothetical protein
MKLKTTRLKLALNESLFRKTNAMQAVMALMRGKNKSSATKIA